MGFWSDVTLGQVLTFGSTVFGFLTLVFSGRAFMVGRKIQAAVLTMAKNIGHPDPAKSGPIDGQSLTQKIESLSEAFKAHVNQDLERRAKIETPGTGRRRADG